MTPAVAALAIGIVLLLAVAALCAQWVYMDTQRDRERKEREAAQLDLLKALRETAAASDRAAAAHRRNETASVVVQVLARDLAAAHRRERILYAGMLDAQREVDQMAGAQTTVIPMPLRGVR